MRSALLIALACVPVVALAGEAPTPAAAAKPALPFIEDDYARAVAEATRTKLPLFVEAWAPW
jgi:hypothetical protein